MPELNQVTAFLSAHKGALFAGGAGLAAAGFAGHKAYSDTGGDIDSRAGHVFRDAAGAGAVVGGTVMGAYLGRNAIKGVATGVGKRIGSWYSGGFSHAFAEKNILTAVSHGPVAMTLGGAAGALIANQVGVSPYTGAAVGAGAMMVGLPMGRAIMRDWKRLPGTAKVGLIGLGALAAGGTARAVMHEPEYASQDVATSDGMGGYETGNSGVYESGLRQRMASMNISGDIPLGLHNGRHGR